MFLLHFYLSDKNIIKDFNLIDIIILLLNFYQQIIMQASEQSEIISLEKTSKQLCNRKYCIRAQYKLCVTEFLQLEVKAKKAAHILIFTRF